MCFIRAMITSFARALTDRYYGVAIVIERKFRVTVLVSYVNACLRAPFRAVCPTSLLDLHSVFLGNFVQLFASELPLGGAPERRLLHERTPRLPVVPQPKAAIAHCCDSQLHARRLWELRLPNPFQRARVRRPICQTRCLPERTAPHLLLDADGLEYRYGSAPAVFPRPCCLNLCWGQP